VEHLKQQKLAFSVDFHPLFYHYVSVESCCTVRNGQQYVETPADGRCSLANEQCSGVNSYKM